MFCYLCQDRRKRPDAKGSTGRDRDAVLASGRRDQAQMAPRLADDLVAEVPTKGYGKIMPTEVSGQLHTASSSSRTKCRRMIWGRSLSSKWHITASRTTLRRWSRSSASVRDRFPQGASQVATLGRLLDHEDKLGHRHTARVLGCGTVTSYFASCHGVLDFGVDLRR